MKHKLKSLAITSSPIILVSSVLGTVYALKIKNNDVTKSNDGEINVDNNYDDDDVATSRFDPSVKYKKSDIFPKVQVKDVYEYIKIKNDIPVFDKEIIAKLVKIIVSGLGVTFGELNFEWQFKDKQNLLFVAYWYEAKGDFKAGIKYLLSKTYSITIMVN